MKGRTTIAISHRLELALRADQVVVLEGALAECGERRQLAAQQGAFATLFGRRDE